MTPTIPPVAPIVEIVLVPRSQVDQLAAAIADLERGLAALMAIKKAQQGDRS